MSSRIVNKACGLCYTSYMFELQNKYYASIMPHYYGDIVRKLFLVNSVVTFVTVPLFAHMLTHSPLIPIVAAVVFGLLAALISPAQKIVIIVSMAVSAIATTSFIYLASNPAVYEHMDVHQTWLRLIYLFLGIQCFFAFYYSVKTIRGYLLKK